jgi:dTDP-4-amino-4,6-dideoxygalactose transaminase
MFRAISPAGHPLAWTHIAALFKREPNRIPFLSQYYRPGTFYPVSSGTAALTVSLRILKKTSTKKEVVIPAYSCPSLVAAVVKAGLRPVLCDLQPDRPALDLEQLGTVAGADTLAVAAVHLYGVSENIPGIKKLSEKTGFFVLEDAAQAFGNCSRKLGGNFGALGDLGVISFGRGKPLSLLHGGAVILNRPTLKAEAEEIYQNLSSQPRIRFLTSYTLLLLLYSFFFHPRTHWLPRAIPFLKLGETYYIEDFFAGRIGAGVLRFGERVHLEYSEIRETRKRLAGYYTEMLEPYSKELAFLPEADKEDDVALLRYPIIFKQAKKRDLVLPALLRKGLGASGSYPVPLNELEGSASQIHNAQSGFPNAKAISQRIMTLPLHRYVREADIAEMGQVICSVF